MDVQKAKKNMKFRHRVKKQKKTRPSGQNEPKKRARVTKNAKKCEKVAHRRQKWEGGLPLIFSLLSPSRTLPL